MVKLKREKGETVVTKRIAWRAFAILAVLTLYAALPRASFEACEKCQGCWVEGRFVACCVEVEEGGGFDDCEVIGTELEDCHEHGNACIVGRPE